MFYKAATQPSATQPSATLVEDLQDEVEALTKQRHRHEVALNQGYNVVVAAASAYVFV